MENEILLSVFKDYSLGAEERRQIATCFEKIELPKGSILLKAGELVQHQYYVESGCLRTYYLQETGKQHTLQFAIKDWWISDYTAYFSQSKAMLHIECVKTAVVYKISEKDMQLLYKRIPVLETFFRLKLEKAFASFQRRILSNLAKPATVRYQEFLVKYPRIEKNLNNYHIASYLGITTESLSRIRKSILKK
ncbi:Crp/Fnr family transcriptional regulator [Tenacibaculum sp. SG-28]|uniref:Crp/Fnr family transcriptional regulator n=1 Tax=Tenacibaculum sp. SG-28 TaxID=754426 RepID=UPI000CF4B45C|nr:Crp/Fnr family transcriptional regulator [Tenacibaculum sp. SG-28]PQJ19587.1 hypothetical protein BSU00_12310 [Tenacibaculum sp. SG-28]